MSKNTNSNIYHFENYIQIQKLNCFLIKRFNNDVLIPRAEKSRHTMGSKQDEALELTVRPEYSLRSYTEKVRKLVLKKCSKILLVLSHIVQNIKAVINFILRISLLVQYLQKQE